MSGEMHVMPGREYRVEADRLILDGCEYSLQDVREALTLLREFRIESQKPVVAEGEELFRVTVPVEDVTGHQSWLVPARSAEEAIEKWKRNADDCQFETEELEIQSLKHSWAQAEEVMD